MKKLVLLLFAVVFSLTQLVAQTPSFLRGDKVLNLGIGIGSTPYYGFNPAALFSASFEVGIIDNILEKAAVGVGGFFGVSPYKPYSDLRATNFMFGAKGSFHYPFVSKLDTYAGLMMGYSVSSVNYSGLGPNHYASSGGFVSILNAGARYYFSNSFAAMSELGLGYGSVHLSFGVAFKF
jgi:hypothetical protein